MPPGYNVIMPAWELPRYPGEWAEKLELFDEIWANSAFIANSLAAAVSTPVKHLPLPTEVTLEGFRGRRMHRRLCGTRRSTDHAKSLHIEGPPIPFNFRTGIA